MRKLVITTLPLLLFILFAGCEKENSNIKPMGHTIPSSNEPTPEWQEPSDYDYSSSMTLIAQVDLTMTYTLSPEEWQVDTNDLLAAFAAGECIGVTAPTDSLFFLFITSPAQTDENITLRYYSSRLHNIFQADTVLHFDNGARLGSIINPLKPKFETINI